MEQASCCFITVVYLGLDKLRYMAKAMIYLPCVHLHR